MPKSATILCIEDEPETAALLTEDLIERGYRVLNAANGEQGLAMIFAERPDLVLCDINMPGLSGFTVLERLAESSGGHHMPFVFLTAFTDREHQLKGRALGADEYVTKPVDFDLLDAIIRIRLARGMGDLPQPSAPLNDREIETLTWVARGKTSAEIATIMGLAKRTVDFHADNARAKLGATNRIEATIRAALFRVIQP